MKNLIHYICKECHKPFFIPKYIGILKKEKQHAEYCPYCGSPSLFNVTFEKEMGTL